MGIGSLVVSLLLATSAPTDVPHPDQKKDHLPPEKAIFTREERLLPSGEFRIQRDTYRGQRGRRMYHPDAIARYRSIKQP